MKTTTKAIAAALIAGIEATYTQPHQGAELHKLTEMLTEMSINIRHACDTHEVAPPEMVRHLDLLQSLFDALTT